MTCEWQIYNYYSNLTRWNSFNYLFSEFFFRPLRRPDKRLPNSINTVNKSTTHTDNRLVCKIKSNSIILILIFRVFIREGIPHAVYIWVWGVLVYTWSSSDMMSGMSSETLISSVSSRALANPQTKKKCTVIAGCPNHRFRVEQIFTPRKLPAVRYANRARAMQL